MVTIRLANVDLNQQYFEFLREFVQDHFFRFQFDTTELYIDDNKVMEIYQDIDDDGADTIQTWYNHDYLTDNGIKYMP